MFNEELLFEAGVYYRFPNRTGSEEEKCPIGMIEFRYDRFKNGKRYGTGRVFIDGRNPIDAHKLIENWNRKGADSGYCYVILVS